MNRLRKLFSKIPELTTPRLLLRRIRVSDADDMFEYSRDCEVTRYLLWSPHQSRDYTRRYLEQLQSEYRMGEFYDWAIVLRESGKMVGTCGFTTLEPNHGRAEVGYVLSSAYWGQGIAAEALSAVLRYGFGELRLNRIEARYMAPNVRSRRVMEKCGMTFEGILKSYMYVKEQYRDIGVCAILASEYFR